MGLFDSVSTTDDFCWTAEALQQGMVSAGQLMEVEKITRTANGQGFVIQCVLEDGNNVYDYAFKNSKQGKVLSALFTDPELADGISFRVKAQDKVKNAVITDEEVAGIEWHIGTDNERECLTPVKKASTTARKTGGTAKS